MDQKREEGKEGKGEKEKFPPTEKNPRHRAGKYYLLQAGTGELTCVLTSFQSRPLSGLQVLQPTPPCTGL